MNIGIVGAGVMGLLVARACLQAGWSVTLWDAGTGACSTVAAGMLAPFAELDRSDPFIFDMGRWGLHEAWPTILAEFPEIYFRAIGSVFVSHPKDRTELESVVGRMEYRGAGVKGTVLSRAMLHELEPDLSSFDQGYYFADEGQLDNQSFLIACLQRVRACGATVYTKTAVDEVEAHYVRVAGVSHAYDWVIDCRGMGAKKELPDLRPLRGEVIRLHAPQVTLTRPIRIFHPRYVLYVVPREDHHYFLGATELESGDLGPISVRSALELLTAAYYVHPGFAEARIEETLTQCRPTFSHHNPEIVHQPGLMRVNGLYRHGFLIAPALLREVMCQLHNTSVYYPSIWRNEDARICV